MAEFKFGQPVQQRHRHRGDQFRVVRVGGEHRAFAECQGAAWGEPIDLLTAFAGLNMAGEMRCVGTVFTRSPLV